MSSLTTTSSKPSYYRMDCCHQLCDVTLLIHRTHLALNLFKSQTLAHSTIVHRSIIFVLKLIHCIKHYNIAFVFAFAFALLYSYTAIQLYSYTADSCVQLYLTTQATCACSPWDRNGFKKFNPNIRTNDATLPG
jgi:hypothetical protein